MITHELPLSALPGHDAAARRPLGLLVQSSVPAQRGLSHGNPSGRSTSAPRVRASAHFTEDGTPLGTTHRPYSTHHPRPGWAEQDPRDWWAAITAATRQLMDTDPCRAAGQVVAIAASTTASTVAVVDAAGTPLRPAILWMDARGAAEVGAHRAAQPPASDPPVVRRIRRLRMASAKSDVAQGMTPMPTGLPHASWRPSITSPSRLTGRWVGSQMNAVCKYNYDSVAGRFPAELYAALGMEDLIAKLLDEIIPVGGAAGTLTAGAAADLAIPGTPVVAVGGISMRTVPAGLRGKTDGAGLHRVRHRPRPSSPKWTSRAHPKRCGAVSTQRLDARQVAGRGRSGDQRVRYSNGPGVHHGCASRRAAGVDRPGLRRRPGRPRPEGPRLTSWANRTPHREARLRGAVIGLTLGTYKGRTVSGDGRGSCLRHPQC